MSAWYSPCFLAEKPTIFQAMARSWGVLLLGLMLFRPELWGSGGGLHDVWWVLVAVNNWYIIFWWSISEKGGLEHGFYFSIYWECHHPKWLDFVCFTLRENITSWYFWRLVVQISTHFRVLVDGRELRETTWKKHVFFYGTSSCTQLSHQNNGLTPKLVSSWWVCCLGTIHLLVVVFFHFPHVCCIWSIIVIIIVIVMWSCDHVIMWSSSSSSSSSLLCDYVDLAVETPFDFRFLLWFLWESWGWPYPKR